MKALLSNQCLIDYNELRHRPSLKTTKLIQYYFSLNNISKGNVHFTGQVSTWRASRDLHHSNYLQYLPEFWLRRSLQAL